MKIVKYKNANLALELAVKTLRQGGLLIFPCETVYGIAADAKNPKAMKKLSKYKQRPLGKPFAIMVSDQRMAEEYVDLNQTARSLYEKFLPGPLTVVSKGKNKTAPGVESETGTLGVRIPDFPFMIKVIREFGGPIAATSANASYKKRPYTISDIWENISEKQKGLIDLIIDAGELPRNEPSTVVDTTNEGVVVLRQGEKVVSGKSSVVSFSEENTQNIGKELWQKYEQYAGQRAIIFALEGPMGAGKTQLTKGIAKALGIEETIVSPTYTLESEYDKGLVHIDAWRLERPGELESLGFAKRISDKSVLVIEWADRVSEEIRKYLPEAVIIWVKLDYGKNENERRIGWRAL